MKEAVLTMTLLIAPCLQLQAGAAECYDLAGCRVLAVSAVDVVDLPRDGLHGVDDAGRCIWRLRKEMW